MADDRVPGAWQERPAVTPLWYRILPWDNKKVLEVGADDSHHTCLCLLRGLLLARTCLPMYYFVDFPHTSASAMSTAVPPCLVDRALAGQARSMWSATLSGRLVNREQVRISTQCHSSGTTSQGSWNMMMQDNLKCEERQQNNISWTMQSTTSRTSSVLWSHPAHTFSVASSP